MRTVTRDWPSFHQVIDKENTSCSKQQTRFAVALSVCARASPWQCFSPVARDEPERIHGTLVGGAAAQSSATSLARVVAGPLRRAIGAILGATVGGKSAPLWMTPLAVSRGSDPSGARDSRCWNRDHLGQSRQRGCAGQGVDRDHPPRRGPTRQNVPGISADGHDRRRRGSVLWNRVS